MSRKKYELRSKDIFLAFLVSLLVLLEYYLELFVGYAPISSYVMSFHDILQLRR